MHTRIVHHAKKITLGTVSFLLGGILGIIILLIASATAIYLFNRQYEGKVYPTVTIDSVPFGGQTPTQVKQYWTKINEPFLTKQFEFRFDGKVATISASDLDIGYDASLLAAQSYLIGRSRHPFSNIYTKFIKKNTDLTPYFRWKTDILENAIDDIATRVDIPVENALFEFSGGKVKKFRPSKDGRRVNKEKTKQRFATVLEGISTTTPETIIITVAINTIKPEVTTQNANSFGIKERIGRGYSEFAGSILGRIHNVALAASRLHGLLIKPGEIFSFNKSVGDISAATGYKTAYIIQNGRTVLGDGGGVCQVSSTLFRAALLAGLPIVERRAHAYRVHYYEEGGFKPGLDATVFSPSVDFQFKNDTQGYILIQAKPDIKNLKLTIDLYGTSDGRKAEILNHKVWGQSPPPPPLYQDDPTLPKGTVRQVDFDAWGAQASFQYKVIRGLEVLQDTTFSSSFRPWQAVYLRGTQ